ncbi:MAG: hypothetical protein LBN32_03975 [Helicobacteraceae bacterium]|jgi:hypothetical protein|nr:hypothetical protein [Helicobacteraceae bacterium]
MNLLFEFVYVSQNAMLENFLVAIAQEAGIAHSIKKNGGVIELYVTADEAELGAFADKLASALPISIYMRKFDVKACDEIDITNGDEIEECKIYLPFTPSSLQKAENEINPYIDNEIGFNEANDHSITADYDDQHIVFTDFKEAFETIAALIDEGKSVMINNRYSLSKLIDQTYKGDLTVMACDIGAIGKIAVAKNEDVNALASIERPIVTLPTNMIFAAKYPSLKRLIAVALPCDKTLYLLSRALMKRGIDLVAIEGLCRVEVTALDSRNLIVKDYASLRLPPRIARIAEPHYRQFASAMIENGVEQAQNCGIYLSKIHDDRIMFNSPKDGVVDLLSIDVAKDMETIIGKIAAIDENSGRLIDNYKNNSSDIYRAAKDINLIGATNSIYTLWSIAASIAGFDIDRMLEYITYSAVPNGPRVDYRVEDNQLNPYKFLRSVISFHLASVDSELLSYGIAESLIYFLVDVTDTLKNKPEHVILCGSLFANKRLSSLAIKHLKPNQSVLFNNELPIEL